MAVITRMEPERDTVRCVVKAVSTTQGGLTRSMEYHAAGCVISLTNVTNYSDFSYDALDRRQQAALTADERYHYET
ncbi:hypothetical protein ACLK15_02830 [Escherichia coli]